MKILEIHLKKNCVFALEIREKEYLLLQYWQNDLF